VPPMRKLIPLLAACLLLGTGCASTLGYLAKQGRYLLKYSTGTRSARALLADPATPGSTRALLERAQEIRRFAVQSVGLRDNGSYTRYRAVDGDHLVDVVQACDALTFEAYSWRYPLLGKLPYRGYYVRADALAEAARLKGEGYDVIVRPVDAFSTLGITRDPLYSFMEDYSGFELASLIIHELTHATVFIRGQAELNEALAELVGEEGALAWIRATHGPGSAEERLALDGLADADTMAEMLRSLASRLDELYGSGASREEKLARKAGIIGDFRDALARDRSSVFRTEAYRRAGGAEINNAYLSLFRLYSRDVPALRRYLLEQCGGDLRRLIDSVKRLGVRVLEAPPA